MADKPDIHQRALRVNLDPRTFGTFAEIGAGQEVARWFLQVGGAAGTVAKTISAYDKEFSDAIYGKGTRYVSRERLRAMLEHEYTLLQGRLAQQRGTQTQFFVVADTVAARNFAGTNECHGWMGIRFQIAPESEPSDVLLHVNMMDPTNLLQQEALGLLGVNLVYASFYERGSVQAFLNWLFADLSRDRLEIDVVELSGPAFSQTESVPLGVRLVRDGLARAVLFEDPSRLMQPSSLLRKRPLVLERGLFSRVATVHHRMLNEACSKLNAELGGASDPLAIPELTVNPVAGLEPPDEAETLQRLSGLFDMEHPVLLTDFPEAYHLTAYLRRYTSEPLRFVFGASTLMQVMREAQYSDLVGGLLEALGRLLADNVKIYVYPMKVETFNQLVAGRGGPASELAPLSEGYVTADNLRIAPPVHNLYRYLLDAGWILGMSPPGA